MSAEPIERTRLHPYLADVIDATNAVVPPKGWEVMVGMQSLVCVKDTHPTRRQHPATWLKMVYPGSKAEWRLDSEMNDEKPPGLLWHQWWPTLQDAVDAVVAARLAAVFPADTDTER